LSKRAENQKLQEIAINLKKRLEMSSIKTRLSILLVAGRMQAYAAGCLSRNGAIIDWPA
jgi:hypothetical protein